MGVGQHILGRRHVDPSVDATCKQLQIEGTFRTGNHLVTVDQPISTDEGDLKLALYRSFLPIPADDTFPPCEASDFLDEKRPGALVASRRDGVVLNKGRKRMRLRVTNKGDRAVQVGSHYHFIEANAELEFDRLKSYGHHLDIPAGSSVRFEPGEAKTVTLVQLGGLQVARGGSGIAPGRVDLSMASTILRRLDKAGFRHTPEGPRQDEESIEPYKMDRQSYAQMYGPTVGDAVRLATTELWIKAEADFTSHGDECSFGGGKTLRDGMSQASGRSDDECLDLVITNVLIVDWSGIFKADIGVKKGYIVGIGKAGNPDYKDGVDPNLIIGSNTDVLAGEGKIVTAGAIDTHCHSICPQQVEEAVAAGITTMFTGGTGPSTSTIAANGTPGKHYIRQMMQAFDTLPVNCGIIGKGSDSGSAGLHDQCKAGVAGLKVHEDWGATPATIDCALSVCDEHDVQCELHSDSMNESGFVERTEAAFKGRTIHAYHIEGAGGGHAPDLLRLVETANVLPSSTNPTCPYTIDTVSEHLDMAMSCHHLSKDIHEDVAFAESRIRAETIAAEDVLHDIGAISMISSDSQAMGRVGETILRAWNMAHHNKVIRGGLLEDEGTGADNHRVRRYISKYTINPAITQGISHVVGSVEVGKLADLVLWDPARFAVKPSVVLKSGFVASAQMGDPNGSIATAQPIISRPMFAPLVPQTSVMFVSKAGIDSGAVASYGLRKRIEAVKHCRNVGKHDMKFNGATPEMTVDPETFVSNPEQRPNTDDSCTTAECGTKVVTADGMLCKSEPATCLPLAQQHFLN
ncbi:Urease [Vermiconidia calcicola]|uniref:Urease n=1 Tax=Vermiconidia calcicola TaxID=1690605 RepID=A0ACC3N9J8_9PEZI|nr:Urease [Vermiconidia calcicola]